MPSPREDSRRVTHDTVTRGATPTPRLHPVIPPASPPVHDPGSSSNRSSSDQWPLPTRRMSRSASGRRAGGPHTETEAEGPGPSTAPIRTPSPASSRRMVAPCRPMMCRRSRRGTSNRASPAPRRPAGVSHASGATAGGEASAGEAQRGEMEASKWANIRATNSTSEGEIGANVRRGTSKGAPPAVTRKVPSSESTASTSNTGWPSQTMASRAARGVDGHSEVTPGACHISLPGTQSAAREAAEGGPRGVTGAAAPGEGRSAPPPATIGLPEPDMPRRRSAAGPPQTARGRGERGTPRPGRG